MKEHNSETKKPIIADFARGLAVGKLLEIVAIEGFAHQVLAHRNLKYHQALATMSRYTLIAFGMSPNRFAVRHRVHHTENMSPAKPLSTTIREVLKNGAGRHTNLEEARPHILFPGYTFDDDPLIKEEDGQLAFRTDPPLEQFIAKNGIRRVLPFATLLAGNALINKVARRNHPFKRSLTGLAGVAAGLTVQNALIGYGEARAGIVDGQIETQKVGPFLGRELERHQDHHDRPWILSTGHAVRHRVGFTLLSHLKLSQELKP